jgi:hypothetical protein
LVHQECAIECCRAVDIIYTLEDGKSARCPNHHKGFKKKLNSSQVNDNNSGNSHEIDQRNDSNEGKCKEGSSESKNEKRANVNVNDEESGKDGGTEVADQIKSSCNLNDDGGKKQSGKEGATKGSCEKDISAETEDSEGNIYGIYECADEDNVFGENPEKSRANENNNNGGNSDEINQKIDSNEGSKMEISTDERPNYDEPTKENGANDDRDDEESGKDSGMREPIKLNPVAI